MYEYILLGLTAILVLGIGAQWIAWRFHLPAVLLLIILGLLAGPISGFIRPDEIFCSLLVPLVTLSVALILFEGGMSLNLKELQAIGTAVRRLVSVGLIITWLISAAAAYFILNLSLQVSALLGAILVVTGPTVIVPLLRHVRPVGKVGSVLRWEGILIDPIGAVFALIVYQTVFFSVDMHQATLQVVLDLLRSILIGGSVGVLGALIIVFLLKDYLIPDFLQNSVVLMSVIVVFTTANLLQPESGLFAVTIMGIALTNQNLVPVKRIMEFKETIQVLLISFLFIVLTARLQPSDLSLIGWKEIVFLLVIIFIARPASVFLATIKTGLTLKERLLISAIAPRGIVAVMVSAVFSLRLTEGNIPQAEYLVPLTFLVVIGTVIFYSLTSSGLARYLGLSQPNPQGLLFVGADSLARHIAGKLQEDGYDVSLIDTNISHIEEAVTEGLTAYHENILSEHLEEKIDLSNIGRLLALTANDEVNSLSTVWFSDVFGGAEVYQLPLQIKSEVPMHLRGRLLFSKEACCYYLDRLFMSGHTMKKATAAEPMSPEKFRSIYGETALLLFAIDENRTLQPITLERNFLLKTGQDFYYLGK